MAKGDKIEPAPKDKSQGEHGGNRGGEHKKGADQPKKSSQAAGKDPHRKSK